MTSSMLKSDERKHSSGSTERKTHAFQIFNFTLLVYIQYIFLRFGYEPTLTINLFR